MKYFILTFLFFLATVVSAQEQWERTNGPYGGDIKSLAVNSKGHLFAVSSGSMFHSTDNGDNWKQIDSLNMEIYSVAIDRNDKIYVSTYNNLYASDDDGKLWNKISDQYALYKLDVAGDFIYGLFGGPGSMMRSTDGVNWTQLTLSGYMEDLTHNSKGDVFAVGGQSVYRSTDNGNNWIEVLHLQDNVAWTVFVNKNDDLFIGTFNEMYMSNDNGTNWIKTNGIDILPEYERTVQCFAEDNSGVWLFAGNYHGIFRTMDQGENWEKVFDGTNDHINSIISAGNAFYSGTRGSGFIKSTDNGITWSIVNTGLSGTSVTSVAVDGEGSIYAATMESGIFVSYSGGNSWNKLIPGEWWQAIQVSQDGKVFAIDGYGTLNYSNDKGNNWVRYDSLTFSELYISPSSEIFGVSRPGPDILYKSTNDGKNWEVIKVSLGISDLAFYSNNVFLAAADTDFVSFDNGKTWQELDGFPIYTIEIDSKGKIYAVSSWYIGIVSSTDLGVTWDLVKDYAPESIYINPIDHFFITGNWGEGVFLSTNGGKNWEYTGLLGKQVNCIAGDKNGYNYAGVTGGGVMRYFNNSPVVKVEEPKEVKLSFHLSQNYPNPFNPETIIKYGLQERNHVNIKVFDVLGKEIKTLVDEEKSSGNYEVKFNAANLASGIYYYKLTAGDFVEVQKMLLLR